MILVRLSPFGKRLAFLLGLTALLPSGAQAAANPNPVDLKSEIPLLSLSALIRPLETLKVQAPLSGKFTLVSKSGPIEQGAIIGRYDDHELRARADTTRLRLQIAQLQETDALAELPARRHDAQKAITDLESQLAMLQAVKKDPALLDDLPADLQVTLQSADESVIQAQLASVQNQLARMNRPDYAETSAARLAVLEAESALVEIQTQLKETVVTAPTSGLLQASASLASGKPVLISVGQEIGTLRDTRRLLAVVPATSPYLLRTDLHQTILRITGPGGITRTASYRDTTTETTPISNESRVCGYEFSEADSKTLAGLLLSNTHASIFLRPSQPVAIVSKLEAALAHPGAFKEGWSQGADALWPGWKFNCEGETDLGLVKATP